MGLKHVAPSDRFTQSALDQVAKGCSPPRDYRWDAPAKSTILERKQPRPFHEVFNQREPLTTGHPVWVEGVRANELVHPSVGTLLRTPNLPPLIGRNEASSSSTGQGPALPATQMPPQDREEYLKACERDEELEDEVLACVLATEPPESRGIAKGDQVRVKFPNGELLALEINNSDQLSDLIDKPSRRSETIGPISDVYATCGGKPIDPGIPLRVQNVQEGNYLRIHYRLRGRAPGQGRQECYSFVEGRCTYEIQCLFSHDTSRVCCSVRGSVDHVQEQRVYNGGGNYDPQLDPNALEEAERAAARNRTPPSRLRPAEPSHPPPQSIWNKYHSWSSWPHRHSNIWYGTDDEEQEEWLEPEPRRVKPPSPPQNSTN